MDTILFVLIIILSLFSCKKDSNIQKIEEDRYKDFIGIFELYPSYKKIFIKFEKSPHCLFYEEDTIKDCYYMYIKNRLSIYFDKDLPVGIFVIESENDKRFIRGLWKNQVRFLRKIQN